MGGIIPPGMPWHYGIGKKSEPVTMQAPVPLPAREQDCGCHQRTPRFPKPLPRPEDTAR